MLQKYKQQEFSLEVSRLFPEDFHTDKGMARFHLEYLMNVTYTNYLPLKIFHLSRADTLTGSTERLSAMLKWNNSFFYWHLMFKTLMQIL